MNSSERSAVQQQHQKVLCVFSPIKIHPFWEKLIIGRSISEADLSQIPVWKKLLILKSYGQFYRANPQPLSTMIEIAKDQLTHVWPDAVVDAWVQYEDSIQNRALFQDWGGRLLPHQKSNRNQLNNYDFIVCLYPDALGSGWRSVERDLQYFHGETWVLNGRRRFFQLTKMDHRALKWRRFITSLWISEIILIVSLFAIGLVVAMWDAIRQLAGADEK
jgi:hypothetical protein